VFCSPHLPGGDRHGGEVPGPARREEQQPGGDDDDVVEHRRPGRWSEDVPGVEDRLGQRADAVEDDLDEQQPGQPVGQGDLLRRFVDAHQPREQRRGEHGQRSGAGQPGDRDGRQPLDVAHAAVPVPFLGVDEQRDDDGAEHAAQQ
jgi:hypothetical protein